MGQQNKEWMIGNTTLAENEGEKKTRRDTRLGYLVIKAEIMMERRDDDNDYRLIESN